jgi:hypothetical protein
MRHPDEGEIHAWLDGALDPATVAGLEAHVAACPDCAAAVAEARGLIAGASRILLSLDGVPGGVIPMPSTQTAGREGPDSTERHLQRDIKASPRRRTPWYARRVVQIAAGLMLVAGIGGIVARTSGSDQLSVQFETEGARAVAPVAVDFAAGAPPLADAVALEKAAAAVAPPRTAAPAPAAIPNTPSSPASANQPVRRADEAAIGAARGVGAAGGVAGRLAGRDAGSLRGAAVADGFGKERLRAKVATEAIAAPPPVIVASPMLPVPQAPAQSVRQMDSVLNSIAVARPEADQLRQTLAPLSGILAGKVTAADGTPLQSASVVVATAAVAAQTAADGSFTLPPLPPGRYTLEARRIGYDAAKIADIEVISGETAFATLALKPSSLKLSEVVVTGTADAAKRERLGFTAARSADVSGACFALDIDASADVDGLMLLPRKIRIRMTDASVRSQLATGDIAIVKGAASASAYGSRASPAATVVEPVSPLPWQAVGSDSIAATWTTESDVVTFRLRISGSDVRGTAVSTRGGSVRTSKVSGRKVSCGGQ